jgi:NAD(P)-dependent dehydrogenase (short-subunit alcohol dehydrogenase family)
MRHSGKVAMVTGAGSGIGQSTALVLANEGAKLIVADINEKLGQETVSLISKSDSEAHFVKMDVSISGQVQTGVDEGTKKFGRLDILVNNAGVAIPHGSIEKIPEETWDNILDVNLKGMFLCSKYAIPHIAKSDGKDEKAIVNIASVAGLFGEPNGAAYCASKGGIIALTRAMAMDCAPLGIRVNCICPGAVMTPLQRRWYDSHKDPERTEKLYESAYPLRRIATPEEVGRLASFLASDEASFITGSSYVIDGGMYSQNHEALLERIDGNLI